MVRGALNAPGIQGRAVESIGRLPVLPEICTDR